MYAMTTWGWWFPAVIGGDGGADLVADSGTAVSGYVYRRDGSVHAVNDWLCGDGSNPVVAD